MMRLMTRWTLAGLMALVALAAVTVFGVAPATAAAAPSKSSFAGKYVGNVPNVASPRSWKITISDSGVVTGSYNSRFKYRDRRDPHSEFDATYTGDFDGTLDADGDLEVAGEQTFLIRYLWDGSRVGGTTTFASSASVVVAASGDLLVTDSATGASEVWARQ